MQTTAPTLSLTYLTI